MSVYKNENAKKNPYWFQVMVNGKRVTKRGFRTKGDAQKARAEIITELSKGDYVEPARMTYGAYFQSWLSGRANIAYSTRRMYESYFRTHIDPAIGSVPLSKLNALHIERLVQSIREKGLSDEMVKRVYSTVSASLNAAERKDIIPKNVAGKIERPTVKRSERPIWSDETVRNVFRESKGSSRYWIAMYLAVTTGMRQGEILGLKWADIDLENGIIQVRRNYVKGAGIFADLKTEKSRRTIAISAQDIEVLREHKLAQDVEKTSALIKNGEYNDNDLVVCSATGNPGLATKIIQAWSTLQRKYKPKSEPRITFHDLRHTHASILLKQGAHPKVVSERLGHSTITITLDTYSHLLPNMQADAVRQFGDLLDISVKEKAAP